MPPPCNSNGKSLPFASFGFEAKCNQVLRMWWWEAGDGITERGGNMCGKTGSTNSKMQSAKTECACETARRHGSAAVKAAGNPYVEVSF